MAADKITIYIDLDSLKSILLSKEYPLLSGIVKSHSKIVLDIDADELCLIKNDTQSGIGKLLTDNHAEAGKDSFDKIYDEKCDLMALEPCALFILDMDKDEADKLSRKYGVMVQSLDEIKDDVLQLSFRKTLEAGDRIDGFSNGWNNILANISLPPRNTLVINDNYLFGNTENQYRTGYENLKWIIEAFLPKTLDTEFQLLIVTPKNMDKLYLTDETAAKLEQDIQKFVSHKPYHVRVEFIYNKIMHVRKIISNYFVVVCDRGVALFKRKPKNEADGDNELFLSSILHNAHCESGDTVLQIAAKNLRRIKKGCHEENIVNRLL